MHRRYSGNNSMVVKNPAYSLDLNGKKGEIIGFINLGGMLSKDGEMIGEILNHRNTR